jgi:glycerol 3-phosphatase-2
MTSVALRMVAFDIDGVIHRGARLLPGAPEALQAVLERGLLLRYVTNNSTTHHSAVAARLSDFGLPATPEQVLSSGAATATYLRGRLPAGAPVLVLGGEGLIQELREVGLAARHAASTDAEWHSAATGSSTAPAAVVVGLDRSFTYDTLAAAQAAILAGAMFIATNADATFPAEDRVYPGGGAVVAAVATAAGRPPVVIGKPEPELARLLAESGDVSPGQVLFVGDRLDTDIGMARRAGMISALVLTGVTGPGDLAAAREAGREEVLPDHVLEDLRGLPPLLDILAATPSTRA